jgi:hypothetical protein
MITRILGADLSAAWEMPGRAIADNSTDAAKSLESFVWFMWNSCLREWGVETGPPTGSENGFPPQERSTTCEIFSSNWPKKYRCRSGNQFFFLFDDDFHRVEVAGLARSGHGQWRDDRKISCLVPGHC